MEIVGLNHADLFVESENSIAVIIGRHDVLVLVSVAKRISNTGLNMSQHAFFFKSLYS